MKKRMTNFSPELELYESYIQPQKEFNLTSICIEIIVFINPSEWTVKLDIEETILVEKSSLQDYFSFLKWKKWHCI